MITVLLASDPRYHVDRTAVRSAVVRKLHQQGIIEHIEVSIAIVGNRKMAALCQQYLDDGREHDVLSFPFQDPATRTDFAATPDNIVRLGDIIVSHPQAVLQAAEDQVLVSDKLSELVTHGLMHLLGEHHDDDQG